MAKFLTQEWLDESTHLSADQPERPGATARLQYVIEGGPDGDVSYYWIVEDGHLKENRLGTLPDAEVVLSESYEDAVAIQKGELDTNAAFLQGRIKVDGDAVKLMSLLPITMSSEFEQWQQAVRQMTEY